mmetsp:Transcript_20884/g.70653  ORF Transcript_20884/g.70653 Transcript_20884/m.70653 type:complete len:204 (-) Transcript_20884:83-694(-)
MGEATVAVCVQQGPAGSRREAEGFRRAAVVRKEAGLAALEPIVVEVEQHRELSDGSILEPAALVDVPAEALPDLVPVEADVAAAAGRSAPSQPGGDERPEPREDGSRHLGRLDRQPTIVAVGRVRSLRVVLVLEAGRLAPRYPSLLLVRREHRAGNDHCRRGIVFQHSMGLGAARHGAVGRACRAGGEDGLRAVKRCTAGGKC